MDDAENLAELLSRLDADGPKSFAMKSPRQVAGAIASRKRARTRGSPVADREGLVRELGVCGRILTMRDDGFAPSRHILNRGYD